MTLSNIPLDKMPKGATHYANESGDFLSSWYKFENGEWAGVNTYNADRVDKDGNGGWYYYGKFLNRPITDLIEIVQ